MTSRPSTPAHLLTSSLLSSLTSSYQSIHHDQQSSHGMTSLPIQPWVMAECFAEYGKATAASEPVFLRLSRAEVARMKFECGGHSEQDGISAWWITVLLRVGADIQRIIFTVNVSLSSDFAKTVLQYRTLHRSHPSFPPNLPTLSANVAQMRSIPLDATSSATSIAKAIRDERNLLRDNPVIPLIGSQWLHTALNKLR